MDRGVCSVPDCGRPALTRGWCRPHYNRWRKWGMVLAAIPIGDPRIYAVQKQCERCGETYRAARVYQRWCPPCRVDGSHEAGAACSRAYYHRNLALSRARTRAWVRANPERFKAAQDKYRRRPCPACGKVRCVFPRGRTSEEALCSTCSGLARRQMVSLMCYWCESIYVRRLIQERDTDRRHWCPKCFGVLTKTGAVLGITRERVRQLVNKQYALLNRDGQHATRAEALARVMEVRRG